MRPAFIEVDFPPLQVDKITRQITTDMGRGTVLQVEKTIAWLTIRIIQYNALLDETTRSSDFTLSYAQLTTPVTRKIDNDMVTHWIFRGDKDIDLHLLKSKEDNTVMFWILGGTLGNQSVLRAPEVSLISVNGRSPRFTAAIGMLVHMLELEKESAVKTECICYSLFEDLYTVIAEEQGFKK